MKIVEGPPPYEPAHAVRSAPPALSRRALGRSTAGMEPIVATVSVIFPPS